MASRVPANNTRRATRRGNDENAVPAPTAAIRNKPSTSALGPPQKVGQPTTASTNPTIGTKHASTAGSKAGRTTKRAALGGVTGNVSGKQDPAEDEKKPVIKQEVRQPLVSRTNSANAIANNLNGRPIAPVPHRASARPAVFPATLEAEDEMDVDRSAVVAQANVKLEAEGIAEVNVEAEELDEEEEEEEEDEEPEWNENWTVLSPGAEAEALSQLQEVRDTFQDEVDEFDTTMVAEYADDIFAHMEAMELTVMPNADYMDHQTEIEWTMRTTLIDWLLQVHLRYHMLPETLWIAVNLVDRFLSVRVVSLVKLQLVGVTAMFIAAKYEEILAPSVDEFVYMTENGYSKDEILKGERIIMQTLDFTVSAYCSPYSWVRKISKADDYDIQTRTLSKFLMEVTLLDHRFIRCKPSMVAAIGMYLARKMLNGDWSEAFMYYSNYTEAQLAPGAQLLCERLVEEDFESVYVYKKYANKKFLRASTFARDWAINNAAATW